MAKSGLYEGKVKVNGKAGLPRHFINAVNAEYSQYIHRTIYIFTT